MKTTSICPHVNCLVNHNGNPCNCNMAQYCSQCKKENPIPPSAQTEWERTLLQRLKNKMMRISHLSGQNYGQENWESIVKGGALDIWMFIKEIVASERTRLLSVESMKMEKADKRLLDGTLLINGQFYPYGDQYLEARNSLRQSILSEMEKGK